MDGDTISTADRSARHPAHVGRATLVGHPGVGVLQVWRGQHGQKLEYAGTWRRELDDGAVTDDRQEFEQAMRAGQAVRFEGVLDDPGQPERDSVAADVLISSISSYAYLVDPEDPRSRRVDVTLVNFRPVEEVPGV